METQVEVTQTLSSETQSGGKEETPQAKVQNRLITTRIVGVSLEGRQQAVARCRPNDVVWLERECENIYDPNAVRIIRNNTEELGYINRHLAAAIAPTMDAYGLPVRGKVEQVIGSHFDGYSLGLVISFKLPKLNRRRNRHGQFDEFFWLDD